MPTINATTAAITLTENSSTINAKRGVAASIEVISLTVNSANVLISGYLADSVTVEDIFGTVQENTNLSDIISIESPIYAGITLSLVDNSLTISDALSVEWTPNPFVDSINISSDINTSITSYLSDIINIVDTFGPIIQSTSLKSTFKIEDTPKSSVVALLTDSLTVVDTQEIAVLANLVSSFTAQSTFIDSLVSNATLTSTFELRDLQATGFSEYLVDTGLFSSSLEDLRTQIELLADSMTLTDVQILSASVSGSLTDTMQFNDTSNFEGSVYNVVVLSTLEMGNVLWSPDFGAIAWVMNTESLSIAPYNNFGFHSIAAHAGKVFAVSPEGVFELTGETDNGRKIDAYVKGGFNDFGSPQRKRASDLYVSYTGGMIECGIETYDGPKTVYNYPIEEREANAPRNNRMKVGRGLVSRYWRTEVHNLEGAAFKVYEIGLNTVASKRRL